MDNLRTHAGFGNLEHHRTNEIKDINDIQEISKGLEKDLNYQEGSIVIINFIKLP
ncbi:hypothetical protein P343_07750 [Sporolactobacillus laevolacticus DSM 442]|uniref:Uncharacterized protein n=1 Tax=Sporolactobacillus laevolacticus DSM 442 TaxID=1395513 RepID=V6J611_9BACL|nr:hypothetical protein P343_07750 [Sporolactobacillus laevolacticus DSM 442]